jgi:hypothetical protein
MDIQAGDIVVSDNTIALRPTAPRPPPSSSLSRNGNTSGVSGDDEAAAAAAAAVVAQYDEVEVLRRCADSRNSIAGAKGRARRDLTTTTHALWVGLATAQ